MDAVQASVAAILQATKIISSDSHIIEPPDLWSRHSNALGDRMPHVVTEGDGDWWYVDGKKTMSFLGIQAGDRFEIDSHALRTSGKFTEVRPASYDPARYLAENEQDGIWASVIYPSQGLVLYAVPDTGVAGQFEPVRPLVAMQRLHLQRNRDVRAELLCLHECAAHRESDGEREGKSACEGRLRRATQPSTHLHPTITDTDNLLSTNLSPAHHPRTTTATAASPLNITLPRVFMTR